MTTSKTKTFAATQAACLAIFAFTVTYSVGTVLWPFAAYGIRWFKHASAHMQHRADAYWDAIEKEEKLDKRRDLLKGWEGEI